MKLLNWVFSLKRRPPPVTAEEVRAEVADLREKLNLIARQVEATRKKVYRDGIGEEGLEDMKPAPSPLPGPPVVWRTGDSFG